MAGVDVGTAYLTVIPSMKDFGPQLQKQIGGPIDGVGKDAGKKFGGGFLAAAKSAIGPLAALGAVAGIGDLVGDSLGEAREAQKVGKLTANAIKVTGGAAKISADQVADLSESISNKTGIDDEAVQSGANLLLTFKNVRNEVGKGNDVFNQATGYAQDLAAAGFGDADTAAKMLGKALNDPVKGMTALGKAGVTFTQDQKDQIKKLTESGDLLGAQKIILGEVGTQVGGAAEAAADPMQKLGVVVDNIKEDLGTAFLPMIENVAKWLGENLPGAIKTATDFFNNTLKPAFDNVVKFVTPFVEGIQTIWATIQDGGGEGATNPFQRVGDFLAEVKNVIETVVIPAFTTLKDFIVTELVPRIGTIIDKIGEFITVAAPIVEAFVTGMIRRMEPLLPKIQAIFETVGDIIKSVYDLIIAIIERATSIISFIWENWGEGIMNVVSTVWGAIIGIIGPVLEIIKGIIHTVTALIHGDWEAVWTGMKEIIDGVFHFIEGIVTGALSILKELLSGAWSAITAVASTAWDQFKFAITERVQGAIDFVKEMPGKIIDAIGNLSSTLWNAGFDLVWGFIQGIKSQAGNLITVIKDTITGALPDFVKSALGIASPSKVFMKLGAFTAEGMARGIAGGASRVQSAADSLVPTGSPGSFAAVGSLAGGAHVGGVEQRFYGNIVAHDYADFQRQMIEKQRVGALGVRGG